LKTIHININGIVQGVGFRPFVYSLANRLLLTGKVWNTSSGVEIIISGEKNIIDDFIRELNDNPPSLARIDNLESQETDPFISSEFVIIDSKVGESSFTPISPDICICNDCRKELFDPSNRRFRYPFINCTNCGPRVTIIKDIPYDRPKTTMADFPMCQDCQTEYNNPQDRRFHAQPIACSTCGPRLTFHAQGYVDFHGEDALQRARTFLKDGKILAVKGLGGYHIACDATNSAAISTLIERKHRSEKPLALMAFDEKVICKYCQITSEESELLNSRQHPIVLLKRASHNFSLPELLAQNQKSLGFMLPYTPLHLLLLELEPGFPEVLVMTSGNLSEEPIAYEDLDAFNRLTELVDGFLTHDRDINIRVDDSVLRIVDHKPYFLRRSRGYAPDSIRLLSGVPEILACGAELKNTFCLSKSNYAFLSHHIGDLENYETLRAFENGIGHFQKLFRINPHLIASDLHPDYLSSKYASDRGEREGIPVICVQHHHAHLAACLADNGLDSKEPVIGCILDGTGYGTDGNIWGGEFLLGNYEGFSRAFHLLEVPLPGGDSSIKQPARIGVSYLHEAGIEFESNLPPVNFFTSLELKTLNFQIEKRINTPLTSSMGRLFDAVASIVGIRQQVSYEAQAAIELEYFSDPNIDDSYDFEIRKEVINTVPIIQSIVKDWRLKVNNSIISAKFHNTIARVCIETCKNIKTGSGISTVALSGGVWQNITLLAKTKYQLEKEGFSVLIHRQVPTNDGGISLGQLLVAANFKRD